ncbi:VOC family protein [Dechloromonas sp. XY25]|uniref:VOC family protein n=1 Tax=Dechloromonas hankyongensis TaxID=2908002 RepID=A0ABS9K273_9RHOO|nr:VOC family protein [Dechloromonas hankyongensis]MCG2577248.1 VOC family protein [Dechloromonas hankyongensis]
MSEDAIHNPVGWFEIYVNDMQRAKTFYEAMLGTSFTRLEAPNQPPGMEMWAFPMHEHAMGVTGALVKIPGLEAGGHNILVYFRCADCAVEAANAAKAGGQIVKDKMSIGQYGFIVLLRDSEGNMIGLHSMQ